ncbi:redoxin domain-containing protein [Streptomyces gardneri]|uniref:redoxin domain-containing protein n=1 Tax=Nocardia sputi TaxID=2943705 RepID=UPI001894D0D5|nr:redoxin domain-containing protein [Nocardia sputi]MBF6164855.1 redoxin domain-containing protein [Streptomyces gardneri]
MLATGSPAPEMEFEATTGQTWRLSDYRGVHSALLYFMRSTSCPICNRHVRDLVAHRDEFDSTNICVLIAVPEDRTAGLAWQTENGIPFPVLASSAGTPHESIGLTRNFFGTMQQSGTILIDSDGIIRHTHSATLPTNSYDRKGILAAVDSLGSRTGL